MHREIDWLDHVIQLKMFQRSELIDYSVADWHKRKLKIGVESGSKTAYHCAIAVVQSESRVKRSRNLA